MTDWTLGPIPDDERDGWFMYVRWNDDPPMAVKVEGPYTLTVVRAFIEHEWTEHAWLRLPDLPTDRSWMLRYLQGNPDPDLAETMAAVVTEHGYGNVMDALITLFKQEV